MSHRYGFSERIAKRVTHWTGSSIAFALAIVVVAVWLATGPVFEYSNTWQLVINTGTTIVTFLMVFLIQRTQNKESLAIQLKLNELIAAVNGASNRLIDLEELSEHDVNTIHSHFRRLAKLAREDPVFTVCHSIEEAIARHKGKVHRNRSSDAEDSGSQNGTPTSTKTKRAKRQNRGGGGSPPVTN